MGGKLKYRKVVNIEETVEAELGERLDGYIVTITNDTTLTDAHKGKTLLCYNDITLFLPPNNVEFYCLVRNKDGERKKYELMPGTVTNCERTENTEVNSTDLLEVDTTLPASPTSGFDNLKHYHIE